MAFPFGGGLALIRPQFGRSIRIGGVGTPVYGTSSQFEPSGVARFRTQPDVAAAGLTPIQTVDWTTTSSIPADLTFSRTTGATYFDSSGVIQTAASGAARFDNLFNGTSWVPAGLLVEEQRTNLCLDSGNLNAANWSVNSGSTAASSAVTAPDGSTMTQITYSATSNTYRGQLISRSFTLGQSLTISIWLASGTISQVALGFNGNAVANNISSSLFTLTSTPQRFSFTVTVAQDDSGMYFLLGGGISGGPNLPGTGTIYAWGAQMELGPAPSSYIATTSAAVTRSADIVSTTDASLLAAQGWAVEVGEMQAATAATLLGINTGIGIGATSGDALTTADGGSQTTGNTGTWTGQNRGGIAWDSTPRVSIDLDGGTVVTAANTPVTPTAIYFGDTNNGASGFLNGHIRSWAAYSAVTDSQLVTISAVGASYTIAGGGTTSDAVGTASGTGAATAVGQAIVNVVGSAAGSGAATAVGASTAAGIGAAAGTSTVTATGKALFNGIGSAAGTSTVTATGAALANSVGNAAGTSTVLATGRSTAASIGASAGVSTVSGVGAALAASVGSAAGTSTDTATGSSLAKGVGNAAGTSTALAVSGTVAAAAGTSTVTGVGAALFNAVGAAAGTSTVTATGQAALNAAGTAAGVSTVAATGRSLATGVGNAAGVGTAAGLSPSLIMQAVGLATGSSIVVGVGNAHRPGIWQIAVPGAMDIPTPWKIGNTAIDTIPTVPSAQSIYSDSTPDIYQPSDIYSQTAQNTWKVATRGNMDVQTAWKIAR